MSPCLPVIVEIYNESGAATTASCGIYHSVYAASRAFHKNPGSLSVVLPETGRKFGRWLDIVFVTHCFD